MKAAEVRIETSDSSIPCHTFHPSPSSSDPEANPGPWPAIVYFMDGMGIRPTLLESAAKLARHGYFVLVPDLYHRSGDYAPLDHSTLQDDPVQQGRVMEMLEHVTNENVVRDMQAYLSFLDAQPEAKSERVGVVGYCLGGRLALSAAGRFPERVAVAAAIHGASMATDQSDSAHLLADRMRASIYVAVAEHDPYIIPGETEILDAALRDAGADYSLELYEGCHHGFALLGAHGYDAAADERHRAKLLSMCEAHL